MYQLIAQVIKYFAEQVTAIIREGDAHNSIALSGQRSPDQQNHQ